MFEMLPVNDKNILAIKVTGKLTDADYKQFLPVLEERIRQTGRLSLYVELQDFEGWYAQAAWDDLRFYLHHGRDFNRIAIVAEKTAVHAAIDLANLFSHSQMKFFEQNESTAAWEWVSASPAIEALKPKQAYKNILLPTDFSENADLAAQRALQIAGQGEARLHVLHIVEDYAFFSEDYDPVDIDFTLINNTLMSQADDRMREFTERNGLQNAIDPEIQIGSAKRSIISWAREKSCDLIVMGSKGLHGIERLVGSVSSSVLHKAPCDVLIVKS